MARTWIEQQVERLVARPSDQTQRGAARPYVCCEVLRDGSRAGTSTARYYDVIVLSEGWERVDLKAFSADAFDNGEDRPVHPILRNVSCPAESGCQSRVARGCSACAGQALFRLRREPLHEPRRRRNPPRT